ncbi:MAG: ATP-binding protein [Planctomycetota bacterium]
MVLDASEPVTGDSRHPVARPTIGIDSYRSLSQEILQRAAKGLLKRHFLAEVVDLLAGFARCESVTICLRDEAHCHVLESRNAERATHQRIRLNHDPLEKRLLCRQSARLESSLEPLLLGDLAGACGWHVNGGAATEPEMSGEQRREFGRVLVPIRCDQEFAGLLSLDGIAEQFCAGEGVAFLQGIAEVIGRALIFKRAHVELRERVKELSCLYGIARVVAQPEASRDEVLQRIVELLPPAWLFPDFAVARIDVEGQSFRSVDHKESSVKLRSEVFGNGRVLGFVEVAYTEALPDLEVGPFLVEERNLIDAVAREVTLFTERSRSEEERALLHEQLRHADRLATIGQLAAGVAHELNEPLGNILGFAELILKSENPKGQFRRDMDKIVWASIHAREVIKKLMVFARQHPPKKTPLSLNDLVDEGLYFFEARCAKAGIELVRELWPELPFITADPGQLNQVLVNLVVNAIQAMPRGGTIRVATRAVTGGVVFSVEDTGVGMSEEVKRQAFDPFYTTKDMSEGTGLGLPVVHGIVSSHHGTIEVQSEVGVGTRFVIQFPLQQDMPRVEVPSDVG